MLKRRAEITMADGGLMRFWLMPMFVFALVVALGWPGAALAEGKGSIEFGLSSHFNVPVADAADFDPALNNNYVGLIFHYWLNDTTSVMAGLSELSFPASIEVNGSGEEFRYGTWVLFGGVRYRPELDIIARPYIEAGLGYQSWRTYDVPDMIDERSGGALAYYAGAGLEYDLLHTMTAGLNLRYLYTPMNDRIETEAVSDPLNPGIWDVEKSPLEQVGFVSVGIELTYRFR